MALLLSASIKSGRPLMAQYDEAILQSYADALYSRASWIIAKYTIFIGAFGALIGYIPNMLWYFRPGVTASPDSNGSMILFGIIGLAVGYSIGESKAFEYKLRAQTMLCQRQIELNTRG